MSNKGRPEESMYSSAPELYYNEQEAMKYANNSHIIAVQHELTNRCIELLQISPPGIILDIGCGTGLSTEIIQSEGFNCIGIDISADMLAVGIQRLGEQSDFIHMDIGYGIPFKSNTFDAVISVSTIQWLCNAPHSSDSMDIVTYRLTQFFTSVHTALILGGKAVFQVYPKNVQQMDLICQVAMKCGFRGGWVIDFPNSTKKRKHYLTLCNAVVNYTPPPNIGFSNTENNDIALYSNVPIRKRNKNEKTTKKERILSNKHKLINKGKLGLPHDSKYTGRKRKPGGSWF